MDKNESIEIPFGAFDSELKGWEYTIPEDMEAEIKDGKIIVREKDSEDERIRKEIIDYIKIGTYKKDWIAWLEKQGEQNLANSARTKTYKELKRISQEYPLTPNECININPAWSEEDEKMFEFWNLYYDHKVGNWPNKDVVENLEKFRDWLKFLKDRVQQQPKQEWSEEDKEALRVVTNIFEQHGVKLLCYPAFVHWLKTLPNRITFYPYWKPSDEQLDGIKCAIKTLQYQLNVGDKRLDSLYDDLKKLKG